MARSESRSAAYITAEVGVAGTVGASSPSYRGMGRQQLYLDADALRSVADYFDATAAAIDTASRIRLAGLAFDGGAAGRDYAGAGEALRRALHGWAPELARWSRASAEIAVTLRAGLARYAHAEAIARERVG